jgi:hypothetical protein
VKTILAIFLSFSLLSGKDGCHKKTTASNCYKGQLAVKGICMNYTIKLLEGKTDTSLFQAQWKDEHTDQSYTNVFALADRCNFPANINEGDTFYFTIDSTQVQNCMVCMAYYPVPAKHLFIKVVDSCK